MAVGSGVPYNSHTGNGVTTVFAYGFTLLDAADLVVTINGVVTSAYTVSGVGVAAGGSITFSAAPANGVAVLLQRVIQLIRDAEYQTNGDLQANTVNGDFDRLWMGMQQVDAETTRALRVPEISGVGDLPAAAERANRLQGYDSSGNPIAVAPVDGTSAALALDLVSTSGPTKGAGQVGYGPALNYGANSVGRKLREARKSVEEFGGAADGVLNNDAAIALAASASGGRFHFPGPGTYVCSASVWAYAFTAGDNVTLKVGGTDYAVSNAIAGPWRLTVDSSVLMSLRHAVTGAIVQQWQNGAGGTATYFYRGLSIQTDSHSVQMGPATNGGSCDLLWQRSVLNADPAGNRFNFTFEESTDRLLLSYATTASGAPSFDSAMQLYAGTSPQLLFPAIPAQFNQGVGVKQRAAGGFECRFVPTSSTVADIKQIGGSGATFLSFADAALGFFGAAPVAKPTVTGSRAGNAALDSLLTALANLGLITNSSTA